MPELREGLFEYHISLYARWTIDLLIIHTVKCYDAIYMKRLLCLDHEL